MCGIAGVHRLDGAPVDGQLLRAMAATLLHRGPDGEGYWVDGSVGFAHRRLSIIDVDGSPQPMASNDGRLHLVLNGEIFNYAALRGRLDYAFRTAGDTEVLLAAFDVMGPRCVDALEGQFAFAMHDSVSGTTWLVRDRLGVLPLYYYADSRMIAFASEVKALLPAMPGAPEVDMASLDAYLTDRSVPAPHTLFRGIRKVPPGHWLRIQADGRILLQRYWSPPPASDELAVSARDAVAMVGDELTRCVEAALVADVPVGSYLSGGVDSSLIAALAVRARDGDVLDTFSASFGDPRFDELPYARTVSAALGTRHHEVHATPTDFTELWPRLTWHRDAPISEPADVAVFKLASLAREHVKVVLSGEGSDELFAGYPKYRAARWIEAGDIVPAPMRRTMAGAIERRLPARAGRARLPLRAWAARNEAERFAAWFAPFTPEERARLLGGPVRSATRSAPGDGDLVRRMLLDDCGPWLSDNLLERGDRMSMAASLELRPPFLNHHLVELAFRLPSRFKLRGGGPGATTKWVVKEVARRYLPASIVDRPKLGFRVPLDAWFRGDLADLAWDLLTSSNSFVAQVMDRRTVRKMLTAHREGRSSEEIRIWTLLCLEVWHDVFFRHSVPVDEEVATWTPCVPSPGAWSSQA